MTFEPTPRKSILETLVLFVLVALVVAGAAWLIVLYNQKVEYVNGAEKIREEIQTIQAENVAAKERMFSLFHSGEIEQFAQNLGLVKEQNPEYLEINKPWASASRY